MTTKQVLQLDCREQENQKIIQKVLRQIKPLSKCSEEEDVPFELVEKAIVVMSKKYNMRIRDLVPDVWATKSGTIWRASVVDEETLQVTQVYGLCLYEAFAKCAILMYTKVRQGISLRNGR